MSEVVNYEACLEQLTVYFSSDKYRGELVDAKELFFSEAGLADAEEHEFEHKHNLFFDWYLLTRPLQGTVLTPAQMALDLDSFSISEEQRSCYEALAQAKYGVFEYIKSRGTTHYIKDLFTRKKITVKNSSVNLIAEKGAIFNTHVIIDGADNAFSMGMIFHPLEANKFILEQIRKNKKANEEELGNLAASFAKMYYMYEKYSHVGTTKIYSLNSPINT